MDLGICQGICKNGNACKYKAKYTDDLQNKVYCGKHYTNPEDTKKSKPEKKQSKPEKKDTKKSKPEKTKKSKPEKTKKSKKTKSVLPSDEEIKLETEIHEFCKLSKYDFQNYGELKKQYMRLLLKTHPDKCKFPNLNANELLDNVVQQFNKLKISLDN